MPRIVAIACLFFAWLCANSALWDAMQVVAWGRMFAGNAESMSFSAALKETFNPAKPCKMCLRVAQAKSTAQKQLPPDSERDAGKFLLAIHTPAVLVFAHDPGDWLAGSPARIPLRTEPVPVPPPRV